MKDSEEKNSESSEKEGPDEKKEINLKDYSLKELRQLCKEKGYVSKNLTRQKMYDILLEEAD